MRFRFLNLRMFFACLIRNRRDTPANHIIKYMDADLICERCVQSAIIEQRSSIACEELFSMLNDTQKMEWICALSKNIDKRTFSWFRWLLNFTDTCIMDGLQLVYAASFGRIDCKTILDFTESLMETPSKRLMKDSFRKSLSPYWQNVAGAIPRAQDAIGFLRGYSFLMTHTPFVEFIAVHLLRRFGVCDVVDMAVSAIIRDHCKCTFCLLFLIFDFVVCCR